MQFFRSNGEHIDVIFKNDIDIKNNETKQIKHFVAGEQRVGREEYANFGLQGYRKVNLCFQENIEIDNQIKFEKDKGYSMPKRLVRKDDLREWQWNHLKPECIWDNIFGLPLEVLLCLKCNISFMVNSKVKKLYDSASVFLIYRNDGGRAGIELLEIAKNTLQSLYPDQAKEIEKLSPKENAEGIKEKIKKQLLFDVPIGDYATWKDMNKVARECENQIYTYIMEERPELIGLFDCGLLYEKVILDRTDNIFKQNFFAPFSSDIADKGEEKKLDYVLYFESLINNVEDNIFKSDWRLIKEYRESLRSVSITIKNVLTQIEKLKEQSSKGEIVDKNQDIENMEIENLIGKTEVNLASVKNELDKLKDLAKNAQESNFPPALQVNLASIQNKKLGDITEQDLKKLLDNISSVQNIKSSEILDDVLYDFVKFGYKNMFASESRAVQRNAYVFICGCINKMSSDYLYQKLFPGKESKEQNYIMDIYKFIYSGHNVPISYDQPAYSKKTKKEHDRFCNISEPYIDFYRKDKKFSCVRQYFLLFGTIMSNLLYSKERKENLNSLADEYDKIFSDFSEC